MEAVPQVEAQRKQVESLRSEVQRLQALESEFATLQQRVESAGGDILRLERQMSADTERIAAYEATIANTPQILDGYKALQSAAVGTRQAEHRAL